MEELASRGHAWQDLIDGYSVDLLHNLVRAARINARRELMERTMGVAVAVSNALDLAFGGKGKPLQAWFDLMNADLQPKQERRLMSDKVHQFLAGLPVRRA